MDRNMKSIYKRQFIGSHCQKGQQEYDMDLNSTTIRSTSRSRMWSLYNSSLTCEKFSQIITHCLIRFLNFSYFYLLRAITRKTHEGVHADGGRVTPQHHPVPDGREPSMGSLTYLRRWMDQTLNKKSTQSFSEIVPMMDLLFNVLTFIFPAKSNNLP